ncbi:nuclear transport factor 2 family protein [Chitinimonas sp. BJYL2]|uniref:nuclear transport factor 2 family protein n=1 Tax=Chitinimonas sp. BJYL2 TaxID=2976696 RepID=UPI0022B4DE58|nr:nuclear transport factor 2 family protein [Chitinimonas sp. BJYL2]
MSEQAQLDTRFNEIVAWFEQLTPASLASIDQVYASQARFVDPFNQLIGIDRVAQVYAHMFATLTGPRFIVDERVVRGRTAFLVWRFEFGLNGKPRSIQGGTHLTLDEQGLISSHVDYWDAAAQVYEHVPVLGSLLRWIKRRLAS